MTSSPKHIVDETHWPIWSSKIAAPSAPDEYSEDAIERLMRAISPWVIDVKNVYTQFKARNTVKLIDFQDKASELFYKETEDRYFEELEALRKLPPKDARILALVLTTKFQMAAEMIKAEPLADAMFLTVKDNRTSVCACKLKQTIAKVVCILNSKYNVPREEISLIWGGSTLFDHDASQDLSPKEIKQFFLSNALDPSKMDMKLFSKIKSQILLMQNDLQDLSPDLKLGLQSKKVRQEEIDRFQAGKSSYCLYTFKTGGVALSLPHSDELTEFKCRRKPSGYVYEEDIPKVSTKQRETILGVVWSPLEMVQAMGRVPRIDSLSDTNQTILLYKGTIEERMNHVIRHRLRCLAKVIGTHEDFLDIVMNRSSEVANMKRELAEKVLADDSEQIGEMEVDDEEE